MTFKNDGFIVISFHVPQSDQCSIVGCYQGQLISHFNRTDFKFDILNDKPENGLNDKQKAIETMSIDLLYLHAVFYVNILFVFFLLYFM
jgi:hypothetical protein